MIKDIDITTLVQVGGLWVTPPIQLPAESAQVAIVSSITTVTASVANSPTAAFADISWTATSVAPNDVFRIYNIVRDSYIKLKFTVKPTSISILV